MTPARLYTHPNQKKSSGCVYVCLCNDEFRARVHICTTLLCLSTISSPSPSPSFTNRLSFIVYVLSCRNLMHTRTYIPSIENCQWASCAWFCRKKTIGYFTCLRCCSFPTNLLQFDLQAMNVIKNLYYDTKNKPMMVTSERVFCNWEKVGRSDGSYFQQWSIIWYNSVVA